MGFSITSGLPIGYLVRRIRMFLPTIDTIGILRTRYPIGKPDVIENSMFKELSALRELIMNSASFGKVFSGVSGMRNTSYVLKLGQSKDTTSVGHHSHKVQLTTGEVRFMKEQNVALSVQTSYDEKHSHNLQVIYNVETENFEYTSCDRQKEGKLCADGHSQVFTVIDQPKINKVYVNVTSNFGKEFYITL